MPDSLSKINHKTISKFIQTEYGSDPIRLIRTINGILDSGIDSGIIKNRKIKSLIKTLKFGTNLAIFSSDIIGKITNFINNSDDNGNSFYEKRCAILSSVLDISKENFNYYDIPFETIQLENSIMEWLFSSPKLKELKILKYFLLENNKIVDIIDTKKITTNGEIYILLDYKNYKFIINANINIFNNSRIYNDQTIYFEGNFHNEIMQIIIHEYINNLDIKNNIIKFAGDSAILHPRRNCPITINQFDVVSLAKEIREVINSKRRRAIVLAGRQGTGKSSILRYLEDNLRDYMIIHLTQEDFKYEGIIKKRFDIIKNYQPLILMIEDIDACNMSTKNSITGTFLDCIDGVNNQLNIYTIVTVNDTSKVHSTIINRPGRFDRVYEVLTPTNISEVIQVIKSKIYSIQDNYYKIKLNDNIYDTISLNNIAKICIDNNYTQAEICDAIVEQAFIELSIINTDIINIDNEVFIYHLNQSIEKHMNTKNIISKYYGYDELIKDVV